MCNIATSLFEIVSVIFIDAYCRRIAIPAIRPQLPLELFERVADFLYHFEPVPEGHSATQLTLSSICSAKVPWSTIAGFMGASPQLHKIGMARWVQVLTIREESDWPFAMEYRRWIRYVAVPCELQRRPCDNKRYAESSDV